MEQGQEQSGPESPNLVIQIQGSTEIAANESTTPRSEREVKVQPDSIVEHKTTDSKDDPKKLSIQIDDNPGLSSGNNLRSSQLSSSDPVKKYSEQILDDDELKMPEITPKQKQQEATNNKKQSNRQKSPRQHLHSQQQLLQQQQQQQQQPAAQPQPQQQVQQVQAEKQPQQIQQDKQHTHPHPHQSYSTSQLSSSKFQANNSASEKIDQLKSQKSARGSENFSDSSSNLTSHSTKGSDGFKPDSSPRKDSDSNRKIDTQMMSNFINMKIKNYKGNRSKDEAIIFNSPEERLAYFNKTYEVAERAFKTGRFYDVITQLAKASEFIHPDFFKRDIKIFQEGITHLIKGFMILAAAHFEIKDYESCLMFAEIILQDKESYEAIKLKYKSLQKLNRIPEAQETLKEIIETYGRAEFLDLEFKELYIEQLRQKKYSENDNEENKPVKLIPLLNFFRRQLEISKTQIAISGISSLFLTLLIRNLMKKYISNGQLNNRISVCLGIIISLFLFWMNKTIQNESSQKKKKNNSNY